MENRDTGELLKALQPVALSAGISLQQLHRATSALQLDPHVLELVKDQPEHVRTVGEYVGILVSDKRIAAGRRMLETQRGLLGAITQTYGIPEHILLAIWGIESNFGERMGHFSVLRSLATLIAKEDRRQSFWCEQFVAALKISDRLNIPPERITGSWAGAMGHTQFIPTTYLDFAVDFDGDGKADIWLSVADGLASAANYLQKSGWRRGQIWGLEIALPDDFDFNRFADGEPRPQSAWRMLNINPLDAVWPANHDDAAYELRLPSGAFGPAFLVTANFNTILTYNASISYALAVAHLADRISGKGMISTPWPNENPLHLEERLELQQCLVSLGYDTGGIDGMLGRASRTAIRHYQLAHSMIADGYPSQTLLEHIRRTC